MNKTVKAILITLAAILVMIIVNMICNIAGHELDTLTTVVVTSILSTAFHTGADKTSEKCDA